MTTAPRWRWRGGATALDRGAVLMGIVNATPDSFSDGGRYEGAEALAAHALRAIDAGAAIIDVGGESTRPGAARVSAAEQVQRVVPVIERIRAASAATISIDTTRAAVAAAALDAGAAIVNDVSGGTEDPDLLPLVAERGAGLVLMHRVVAPPEDAWSHERRLPEPGSAGDPVAWVAAALDRLVAAAREAGVAEEAIAVDPGLGFGKTVAQSYALLAGIGRLLRDEAGRPRPLLLGASRKSFIGAVTGVERPDARLAGSLAAATAAYLAGVRLLRVHDVAAHREALAVAAAIAGE